MAAAAGAPDPGTDIGPTGGQHRTLATVVAEGPLLVQWQGAVPRVVELLDITTGRRQVVCTVDGDLIWVKLRGET